MPAPQKSTVGNSTLYMVRVSPTYFDFKVLCESATRAKSRTAPQWAADSNLVAVVNGGMFQMDGLTGVGMLKSGDHFNNSKPNADNTFFVAGPLKAGLPSAQIIDRTCQDWQRLIDSYSYVCQGIRMVDCQQRNKWSVQEKMWSMVTIATDKAGNVLLFFSRSPYRVHDLIAMLLDLPLDLKSMMYLEGGPEASLVLSTAECKWSYMGSYETGFFESDANNRFWPIPNAIGVVRKP